MWNHEATVLDADTSNRNNHRVWITSIRCGWSRQRSTNDWLHTWNEIIDETLIIVGFSFYTTVQGGTPDVRRSEKHNSSPTKQEGNHQSRCNMSVCRQAPPTSLLWKWILCWLKSTFIEELCNYYLYTSTWLFLFMLFTKTWIKGIGVSTTYQILSTMVQHFGNVIGRDSLLFHPSFPTLVQVLLDISAVGAEYGIVNCVRFQLGNYTWYKSMSFFASNVSASRNQLTLETGHICIGGGDARQQCQLIVKTLH